MADRSKFDFIGAIPEAMFLDVPPSSMILEGHRTLTPSGPRPVTGEFQSILDEVDKPKKGAKDIRNLPRMILRKKDPLQL